MTGNDVRGLQAARRARGWTQRRLMTAMRSSAPSIGLALPLSDDSLKTQLTRWENGRQVPGPEYRQLFRLVYGMTDLELGFPFAESVAPPPAHTPALSREGLAYYSTLFGEHVRADNTVGPHFVLDFVRQQTRQLAIAAKEARGSIRPDVVDVAFKYHELLGWLLQDSGRFADAMIYTDRARDLAAEMNDPRWSAYLLMRKSNIATDAAEHVTAATLAEAALQESRRLPARLQAIVLRQSANAYAGLNDAKRCEAAVSLAFRAAEHETDGAEMASYCTSPYVAMEAANCWTQLGRPDRAVAAFAEARTDWPESLRRDKGLALARMSSAHASAGNHEQAVAVSREAIALASITRSARTVHELSRVRAHLAPWIREPDVAEVSAGIASLVANAA